MAWGNVGDSTENQDMVDANGRRFEVQGNAIVGGTLAVTGLTTCNGNLVVPGMVTVADNLVLESEIANQYRIDVRDVGPAGELFIANNEEAGNLHLGKPDGAFPDANVIIQSPRLRVGNENQAGHIDANGIPLVGQPLNIGTNDTTSMIEIGTALVPNQEVSFNVPTRMNNNAISLDAAGALQIIANAQGHGWGASADFVVAGNVVGWFDVAGIHVQPAAIPAP